MLTVRPFDPAHAALAFPRALARAGLTPDACRRPGRVLAFVAEEDGVPVGVAVALSEPRMVQALGLEGAPRVCASLLGRLVRAAGEREVWAWCPAARADLAGVFAGRG